MRRYEVFSSALPRLPVGIGSIPHAGPLLFEISLRQTAPLALGLGTLTICGYALAQGSLSVLIAYLLFGLAGYTLIWRGGRSAIDLFSLAYGLVSIFSVILYVIYKSRYGIPYFIGGSDDLSYERYAYLVAQYYWLYDSGAIETLSQHYGHNSIGYVYLVSLLVRFGELFGGYDTMIPRILNAGSLGVTSVLVSRIALLIGLDKRNAVIAGVWVILFPMMFYSAAHVFRDIITVLVLMSSLYLSLTISTHRAKVFHPGWAIYTGLCLCFFPIMMEVRLLYVIPITVMLLSAWAFRLVPIIRFRLWHAIFLAPVLVAVYISSKELDVIIRGLTMVAKYGEGLAGGVQSAEGGLSILLFNLPEPLQSIGRFGYALITPLPMLYRDVEWNLLGAGALIQFYFSPFVILGIKMIYRDARMLPLILGFGIVFFSYMMGTFTFRHITQWFPFAVLIGMVGYRRYKSHRGIIFAFCTASVVFAGSAYVYLKGV